MERYLIFSKKINSSVVTSGATEFLYRRFTMKQNQVYNTPICCCCHIIANEISNLFPPFLQITLMYLKSVKIIHNLNLK